MCVCVCIYGLSVSQDMGSLSSRITFDSSAYFLFVVWHNAFRMTRVRSKRRILRRHSDHHQHFQPFSAFFQFLRWNPTLVTCPCFILKKSSRQNCSQIPLSCFLNLELRRISRPCVAWQYINRDLFSGKAAAAQLHWPLLSSVRWRRN